MGIKTPAFPDLEKADSFCWWEEFW